VLLRVALRENWLDKSVFFRVTYDIWSALFFAAGGEDCRLERRYRSAASPEDFAKAVRSPDVIAALAAWVLTVESDSLTPEHARFALTAALAIARLPWLWDEVDDKEVCRELAELLANTEDVTDGIASSVDRLGERWFQVVQRGHALRRLESALTGQVPAQLSSKVSQVTLNPGELLWQGSAGFCVVTEPVVRRGGSKVRVLRLQGRQNESNFAAERTVPMLALLDERVLPVTDAFGPLARRVLGDFLSELADGFNA
jgi:hypothetical protein